MGTKPSENDEFSKIINAIPKLWEVLQRKWEALPPREMEAFILSTLKSASELPEIAKSLAKPAEVTSKMMLGDMKTYVAQLSKKCDILQRGVDEIQRGVDEIQRKTEFESATTNQSTKTILDLYAKIQEKYTNAIEEMRPTISSLSAIVVRKQLVTDKALYEECVNSRHYGGRPEIVKTMVNNGANATGYKSQWGVTSLTIAAGANNAKCLQLMLKNAECDASVQGRGGNTALHQAVYFNCEKTVKVLLEKTPEIKSTKNMEGLTPREWAKKLGRVRLLDIFAEHDPPKLSESEDAIPRITLEAMPSF